MFSTRYSRPFAAAAFASGIALLPLTAACGGSNASGGGAASPTGATSGGGSAASSDGGSSSSAASPSTAAPSTPSTTTATLADGGDLQGAKLQQTGPGGGASAQFDSGPGRGPHEQEAGRSPKDIQVIVLSHRDDARACYDQAQKAHPDPTMKGNLDLRWTIDPKGNVTDIGIDDSKSDIHDPGVGKCISDIIRAIHFAVSAKGFETHAHYPFNFNPKTYGRTGGQ